MITKEILNKLETAREEILKLSKKRWSDKVAKDQTTYIKNKKLPGGSTGQRGMEKASDEAMDINSL